MEENKEPKQFTKWFTSVSWDGKTDSDFKETIKEKVIYDFAVKLSIILVENPIFPNSLNTYELFNRRFGFDRVFYGEDKFEDGLEIQTEEVLEKCHEVFLHECDIEMATDDIRRLFGSGEFPFLITKIMEDGDVIYYGYYISR